MNLFFLERKGVTPVFFLVPRDLFQHADSPTHRQPPSATAPHRLPMLWLVPTLAATTRIVRARDASGPASIPGRHSRAIGSRFHCGSETRTHSQKKVPLPVSPGRAVLGRLR